MRQDLRVIAGRGGPRGRDRMLLRAAALRGEPALAAWNAWREGFDPDAPSAQELRLLPAVYRHLRAAGADDDALALAGTLYRRTWFANQIRVRRAADVVAALREASIEAIVLKGLALALLHYGDLGARAMEDVDLLVPPDRLPAALAALADLGYEPLATERPGSGPLNYGTHVVNGAGDEFDVHGYALLQSADDGDLWESPVAIDLGGVRARALAPAEQLLHVCVHGLRWSSESSSGWIPDAMAVIRSSDGRLDWERLVVRAERRRLTAALGEALARLRDVAGARVPEWVDPRLHAAPKLPLETAIQRVAMATPTPARLAVASWDRYRRLARFAPPERRPASFAAFLRESWDVEGSAGLLLRGGRKLRPRRGAAAAELRG